MRKQMLGAGVLVAAVFAAAFSGAVFGVRRAAQVAKPGQPVAQSPAPTAPTTPKPNDDLTSTASTPEGGQEAVQLAQASDDAKLPPLVISLDNSVLLGASGFNDGEDAVLPLHFRAGVKPRFLRVGRDHPNGTRFAVYFDRVGLPLPVDFKPLSSVAFDDLGFLAVDNGYYIQAGEHDFDGDGEPEIVVAVGNGSTELVVDVIKYHPPASSVDAGRIENWELLGVFEGQQPARVEGASLILPYGSQGLYEEETLVKGKFVRTN